jgi:hypothetical protein
MSRAARVLLHAFLSSCQQSFPPDVFADRSPARVMERRVLTRGNVSDRSCLPPLSPRVCMRGLCFCLCLLRAHPTQPGARERRAAAVNVSTPPSRARNPEACSCCGFLLACRACRSPKHWC